LEVGGEKSGVSLMVKLFLPRTYRVVVVGGRW
jgi:hypothetical protein